MFEKHFFLRGYGMNFYFRNIRAPFATTRSFFIQIHLTKLYIFQHIYEHFNKKSFFGDVLYWGIPRMTKRFFFKKSFTPKDSQVSFLNIFSKFQKEVLEDFRRHLTYYQGSRNFDPFYFLRGEISKHAACFDISSPKKQKGSKF